MKFQENLISNGSRAVPCGRMDKQADRTTDRQRDTMKSIVTFRNNANLPKNYGKCLNQIQVFLFLGRKTHPLLVATT